MDLSGAWLPDGIWDKGVVGGLLVAMAFFVLVCLGRAATAIRRYGLWCYLKSALRIDNDSLGLVLVLLILLLVVIVLFGPGPFRIGGP
jgi:hypothetical protein